MKLINLLPHSVRAAQARKIVFIQAFIGVVIGASACGALLLPLQMQTKNIQEAVVETKHNQAEIARQVALAQQQELVGNPDFQSRVKALNTLSKTEVKWQRAFSLINSITPQDIRLASVNYSVGTDPALVKVGGSAPSNLSFAVLVESLRADKRISEVTVDGYTFDPTTTKVTFSLTLHIPLSQLDYSPVK